MTAEEFLAWERCERDKHEFHDGAVFAMAGGSPRHNALSVAVASELRSALRGGDCRTMSSDQRVRQPPTTKYVYPDVAVVCGAVELEHDDVLVNPSVLVAVLSASTEAYDRGNKWDGYRKIPTLGDYLLVSQHAARVEQFQRRDDGSWRYLVAEANGQVTLRDGTTLEVDAIYEGVFDLPADEPAPS